MLIFQKPKGTNDILPEEIEKWQFLEKIVNNIFKNYNYKEIRTPIFENFNLFSRNVGIETDIVKKEMYDFYDKAKRHLVLKPEGTAAVIRSYIENKLYINNFNMPLKLYYNSPMFRYERPQTGRFRQFHQIGIEIIGNKNIIYYNIEAIIIILNILKKLKIYNIKLIINSLGNKNDRKNYKKILIKYLNKFKNYLSKESQNKLLNNPLRILDSKNFKDKKIIKNAPSILNYLSKNSNLLFKKIQNLLDDLSIKYIIDHTMVRGLDYYNHMVFEIKNLNSFTLCAGGCYNGLVNELGGPKKFNNSFGFAFGIERILKCINFKNFKFRNYIEIYIICIYEKGYIFANEISEFTRNINLKTEIVFITKKYLKKQLKIANKLNILNIIIIGEKEIKKKEIYIKNMKTKNEKKFNFLKNKKNILKFLKKERY